MQGRASSPSGGEDTRRSIDNSPSLGAPSKLRLGGPARCRCLKNQAHAHLPTIAPIAR